MSACLVPAEDTREALPLPLLTAGGVGGVGWRRGAPAIFRCLTLTSARENLHEHMAFSLCVCLCDPVPLSMRTPVILDQGAH